LIVLISARMMDQAEKASLPIIWFVSWTPCSQTLNTNDFSWVSSGLRIPGRPPWIFRALPLCCRPQSVPHR
jgi:hypothetical protein